MRLLSWQNTDQPEIGRLDSMSIPLLKAYLIGVLDLQAKRLMGRQAVAHMQQAGTMQAFQAWF